MAVLTFVTSLRHPSSSKDYGRVEQLLVRTLEGLAMQTDERCRAVVVANQAPALPAGLGIDVTTVEVSFPAPTSPPGERLPIEAVRRDKGSKLAMGLSLVDDGHVMFVDADDYVHRDMTAFVAAHGDEPGWFVERGWMYDDRTGLASPVTGFNTVCGTSLVVRRDLLPRVDSPPTVEQERLIEELGERVVLEHLGSHRFLAGALGLAPLPFAGAVYDVDNGENHSRTRMKVAGRPLGRDRAAQFGIRQEDGRMRVRAARVLLRHAARRARSGVRETGRRLRSR